ncbi:NUMOD4 motif-containing HNH endonuclease [Elizabethkingia miricola]|uniref:NUMOD4 domain-containing protein n=1 Tax=Elizabethkingia miricola TaxID=172045 RepID=UPI0015C4F2BD|nr:NUMOD4 domain-containing protein [Elizabethkingia miricola]MCL1654247.1 NUMOD4 motif-containing HNH endonuclease [Elizabethkingia miricola]
MNNNEIWKPVVGYEGSYEISNLGRVRSLDRIVMRGLSKMPIKGCNITVFTNHCGYRKASLAKVKEGKKSKKAYFIHRLIANAFIPNPQNKPFVNHIDGVKLNNSIENLEWVNGSENIQHAYNTGLKEAKKGVNSQNSKFSELQIKEIRENFIKGEDTYKSVAEKYKVNRCTISRIIQNKTYAE